MTTNKISDRQPEKKPVTNNPLAEIAGKFGGKFWQQTQEEIQRSREKDKKELETLLDIFH
ncbi:hypothetical protein Sta7437_2102 [Stanieria cyanosphaera PCC 7437]|uniref:Uncharacterized protein n=1 Tax=Stanieria cyanosphaera (strain ATCC 29371 / PCC 7437) TaxID=111780 RepID=K9XVG0_STAC7|nr:hypothetical protein [Stanieria cyanosphaera]AFZ35652.1 hypothetical protein Sta7437_2102 [Stanieria cyanosphaera PCC 7437]